MRNPIRLTLLLAVAGLAFGLAACGGGEPAGPGDRSGSAEESSDDSGTDNETEGFDAIEGNWQYTGEAPTDVSSLIIEPNGKAKFFAEGDSETYTGTVEDYDSRDGAFADAFKLHMTAVDLDGNPVEGRYLDLVLRSEKDGKILKVDFGDPDDGDSRDFRPAED